MDDLLIKCPACSHQVSRKADTCPNCGHPVAAQLPATESKPDRESGSKSRRGIYVTALVLGILAVFLGGQFGLVAWAAAAFGVISLLIGRRTHRFRWMAWTGLTAGILYAGLNAYNYGHLDSLFDRPATNVQPINSELAGTRPSTPTTRPASITSTSALSPSATGTAADVDVGACIQESRRFWIDHMALVVEHANQVGGTLASGEPDPVKEISPNLDEALANDCAEVWFFANYGESICGDHDSFIATARSTEWDLGPYLSDDELLYHGLRLCNFYSRFSNGEQLYWDWDSDLEVPGAYSLYQFMDATGTNSLNHFQMVADTLCPRHSTLVDEWLGWID